jgi:hypothetical protein
VFEDVSLLGLRPLVGEWGEALEIYLVNHIGEQSLGLLKQGVCEVRPPPPRAGLFIIRIWVCLKGDGTLESNRCDAMRATR